MEKFKHIFKPIRVGLCDVKNRVILSPTFPFFATADGHVNRELIEWIRPIARGGAACVSIGTGAINSSLPREFSHLLRLGQDSVINELAQLFDTVHAYNCKAGVELYPLGTEPGTFDERDKSGKPQIEVDPSFLTKEQIRDLISDYAGAAHRVKRAGGDFIVIHGAHGQIPAAFFSLAMNDRHDEYGCDTLENRARFTVEVLEAIRARVGRSLFIEYRISSDDMIPNSPTFEELLWFVKRIEDKIDLLHVSRGIHAVHKLMPYLTTPLYFTRGYNIDAAAQFKKHIGIPVSAVGAVTLEMAEEAIAAGKLDMVSISRGFIADPELVNKAKAGRAGAIRPCVRCNTCIDRTHNHFLTVLCSVNPQAGREVLYQNFGVPETVKKVAVIGGGPAGMEAARTAAKRGHAVTLFEKSRKLGGMLNIAAAAPFKADIRAYLEWSVNETISASGIDLKVGAEATPEIISAGGYDAVIVAIGSSPIIPSFARQFPHKAVWVGDVELGLAEVGDRVIVAGAGLTGCEAALSLADKNKKVTLIDMIPASQIGGGGTKINLTALLSMLEEKGVEIMTETKLEDVCTDGIVISDAKGNSRVLHCDSLVLSLGVRSNSDSAGKFAGCAPYVITVGDCAADQGTLFQATSTAFAAAMNIL